MPSGHHSDVSATLTDLERKLVDLERELSSVASGPLTTPSGAPKPPAAATRARVEDLRGEIDDLLRFRDQLEETARELVSEYGRLVDRLAARGAAATATLLDGATVVDAGPFSGIAALAALEEALKRVPGAAQVRVRSFDGTRALIDLELAHPVDLLAELRERLALPIRGAEVSGNHVVVDL